MSIEDNLKTPKGFSCKINRRRSKNDIADSYEKIAGKLEAACRRIERQSRIIEKLEAERTLMNE